MKVWLIKNDSHGEVYVYAENVDVTKIPYVVAELEYLDGDQYVEEERENFLEDIKNIKEKGWGETGIEDRFSVELVLVKE